MQCTCFKSTQLKKPTKRYYLAGFKNIAVIQRKNEDITFFSIWVYQDQLLNEKTLSTEKFKKRKLR